jgi:hypothetical protein
MRRLGVKMDFKERSFYSPTGMKKSKRYIP